MSLLFHAARRYAVVRAVLARPRLVLALLFGVSVMLLPLPMRDVTRYLVGWNAGALMFLWLAGRMMFARSRQPIHHWARVEDEGQLVVMLLVVVAALSCLAAIVLELSQAKSMSGNLHAGHIALPLLTIVSAWAFTHLMFALHYARAFYAALAFEQPPGLAFPGTEQPDYSDFLYFAYIIGTSGQTADVSFTSTAMRRAGTAHCVLSFFFNATVLALMINIAAGLI